MRRENERFVGFPRKGLGFLKELAANNDREWFEANKGVYREQVVEPAQAFVVALGRRLRRISKGIVYDTRLNGSGSIFRIYRDTRFSPDKTPYKTHLGIYFWEGARKMASPGYYVPIEPAGATLHGGHHIFSKEALAAYREAVADGKSGRELERILKKIRGIGGIEIAGEHYRRVPRGYDADHPRADLLRHRGLFTRQPAFKAKEVASPEIVDLCYASCRRLAPLHRWLVKVTGGAAS